MRTGPSWLGPGSLAGGAPAEGRRPGTVACAGVGRGAAPGSGPAGRSARGGGTGWRASGEGAGFGSEQALGCAWGPRRGSRRVGAARRVGALQGGGPLAGGHGAKPSGVTGRSAPGAGSPLGAHLAPGAGPALAEPRPGSRRTARPPAAAASSWGAESVSRGPRCPAPGAPHLPGPSCLRESGSRRQPPPPKSLSSSGEKSLIPGGGAAGGDPGARLHPPSPTSPPPPPLPWTGIRLHLRVKPPTSRGS